MAIFKFLLANLKKRKSYSIVICILVFITGLILSVTVSTTQKASQTYDNAFNNMEGPHLMYWMYDKDFNPKYSEWFENQPTVKSVKLRETEFYNGASFMQGSKILKDGVDIFLIEYDPADKMRLIDTTRSSSLKLKQGEVYMPYIYKKYGAKPGDIINYVFGTHELSFKVEGFVEDPIAGDDMSGSKLIYISEADMQEISQIGGDSVDKDIQIRVRMKHFDPTSVYKLEKDINKQFGSISGSATTYMQFKSDHLTLPKVALVVMIAFASILCIITITILRYAILATIEADYLNIGILKALGFTPSMIQIAITGQYTFLAIFSGIFSLVAGAFLTPLMGEIILKSSGLYFTGRLSIIYGILTLAVLTFLITLFAYLTARRTKKISPVRAIANGIAPVYFSSRISVKLETIRFLPFDVRMALKQVLTKSKRYVLLTVISALLSFALVFFLGLVQTFNSEKAINLVGGEISDIELDTDTKADAVRILGDMKRDYKVEWIYYEKSEQLIMDDEKTYVRIRDDFDSEGLLKTIEGRHPKNDNEIALSMLLKVKFNKGVGEYVAIKDVNGQTHRFLITGIFQTIDNGGEYARITESGMKVLNPGFQLNEANIRLKSHENLDSVINSMRKRYSGYEEISNNRTEAENKINTIKSVFSAISKLVFVLTIILIGFITLLIMKITLYSETRELGIFKAVGFSSAKIRLQLALRFALVTILGGLMGVTVEAFSGSRLFSMALRGVGLSEFIINFNLVNAIIPIVSIAIIAMLAAYVTSGNTKRVSAYVLINE